MSTSEVSESDVEGRPEGEAGERPSRGVIFRDLLIFQFKLWLDGLKDIVLSPLSIIGFGIDLLFGGVMKGSVFYKVLKLGERYDLWLNLFGAAENAERSRQGFLDPSAEDDRASLDDVLRRHVQGPTPTPEAPPPGPSGSDRDDAPGDAAASGGDEANRDAEDATRPTDFRVSRSR